MKNTQSAHAIETMLKVLRQRLSLQEDKASDELIDQTLRQGVEMRGTNLWVLVFAIFVASIGLNVNSTAVIIGAMLISPLMGPIMGMGYGAGINDFQLIRDSVKHLGVAVLLALLTSTLYFLVTPLDEAQSEILARTMPTIWDVLIAFLGGLAGIVGVTRKEKSNVIPGVAIATALMPPLCTAGYGLANANVKFFFGAFYLFAINSVFIAVSAALVTRAFHVRSRPLVDSPSARKVRRYMAVVVVITVLPSIYLAYQLVQDEVFRGRAGRFVQTEFSILKRTHVTQAQIDAKQRSIDITLVGEYVPAGPLAAIADRLGAAGLEGVRLNVHQSDQTKVDVTELKTGLLSDLYTKSQQTLDAQDQALTQLRSQFEAQANLQQSQAQQLAQVPVELHALFPQIRALWLARDTLQWSLQGIDAQRGLLVSVITSKPLSASERTRIEAWLRTRLQVPVVRLVETRN